LTGREFDGTNHRGISALLLVNLRPVLHAGTGDWRQASGSLNKPICLEIATWRRNALLSASVCFDNTVFLTPLPPMKKQFKIGAFLLLATGAIAVTGATPVKAAVCPGGSTSFSALPLPPAFTCQQGAFNITINSRTGFSDLDGISFSNPNTGAFTYTVNSNQDWTAGTYALNYTVTAPTAKLLSTFTNNSTSSDSNAANTWTVVSQTAPQQTGTSTMTGGNGTLASSDLTPDLFSETFIGTLNVTAGDVQSVNFRVNTSNTPPVPGPLPVLGAAAAFGFSRKVRNRIKAAA